MSSLRRVVLGVAVFVVCSAAATLVACASRGGLLIPTDDWRTPLPNDVNPDPAAFLASIPAQVPSDSVHVRVRPGNCPHCIVQVRVRTIGNTNLIDPENGPSPGRPIARIDNLDDTDTESVYGFSPSSFATYFFWVDRAASGKARLTVLQVPTGGGGQVTAGHQQILTLCHKRPAGQVATSDVDFEEYRYDGHKCDARVGDQRISRASISLFQEIMLVRKGLARLTGLPLMEARGGWIDCNSGCCT